MHPVPSSDLLLLTRSHVTSFYGGSFFHRLKHIQKNNRLALLFGCHCRRWMFVSPVINTPACRDISSIRKCISMSDIKICPTESVSVEDIEMPTSGFDLFAGDSNKCNVVREYEQGDSDNRKTVNPASEKPFSNTVTFLALAEPISFLNGFEGEEKVQKSFKTSKVNESSESVNEGKLRLTSLPCDTILPGIPLKLISALKGSREKQLMAPKNLSVTWAPDVYDPTPTSVSHALSSRNQRGKKYGKNKYKGGGGKSSQGSKGKDKKQARKSGGGTRKSKPLRTTT